MALFAYTASTPRVYPEFGFTAEVGDVADFGSVPIPNDGRWVAAAPGAAATKTVRVGAPSYELPGAPAAGDALVWDDVLGQYVPVDLSQTYASAAGALFGQAANPDTIAVGAITRDSNGAATSFGVVWRDGATGTFTGTPSTVAPGAIDSYTVTHILGGVTTTYTQPALTRDATSGAVTARPAITVS